MVSYPSRIRTGVRNTTIPIPAMTGPLISGQYVGDPDGYSFTPIQKSNYKRLKEILDRNNLKFNYFFASTYKGRGGYQHPKAAANLITFIGVVGKLERPKFIWYKYEGMVAGGGQNHVYVYGHRIKLTNFLDMHPIVQDRLLQTPPPTKGQPVEWIVTVIIDKPGSVTDLRRRISTKVMADSKDTAINLGKEQIIKTKVFHIMVLKGYEISWIDASEAIFKFKESP